MNESAKKAAVVAVGLFVIGPVVAWRTMSALREVEEPRDPVLAALDLKQK